MALRPIDRYPGQVDEAASYPHGKARNAGAYQDGTGTPLEMDWLNDLWGFEQALLAAASITPTGDPDEVGASQYLDAIRELAVDATVSRNIRRALALRPLDLNAIVPASGSIYVGAVSILSGSETLIAKGGTDGVLMVVDSPVVNNLASATTGLTEIRKLISSGSRVLAIGAGGNRNAYSTTSGNTWVAGGVSGLSTTPADGVWDGTRFVISTAAGKASSSTNGVAWTAATGGSDISDVINLTRAGGLAALGSGKVIAAGGNVDGSKPFAVSVDHGATWSLAGSIPSSDYVLEGYVAGDGGAEVYWLGKPDGEDRLDLWVSSDGVSWSKRAEVEGFHGSFRPKLLMCQDTGLLLAVQDHGTTVGAAASIDGGFRWSELVHYRLNDNIDALAVANGRVFSGFMQASDRL